MTLAAPVRSERLPSGEIRVQRTGGERLEDLLDFGVRQNPKRGFLFVSKVLGKHLAVRPGVMLGTYARLAAQLSADLPGPVVFVGLAETATALGQGVFTAYAQRTNRTDLLYLNTTRYPLAKRATLTFEEAHSHATTHFVHAPTGELTGLLECARSLVLIDDEISTGATLQALARAVRGAAPHLGSVTVVSLTDFLGEQRASVLAGFPVPAASVSLLQGSYAFTGDPAWQPALPSFTTTGTHRAPPRGGRVGLPAPTTGFEDARIARLARDLRVSEDQRVLVLGTGEFQFEPFLLALELERQGVNVHYHASTRSPIVPFGPVRERLSLLDPYAEGVPNYLYNLRAGAYDRVLMCFETPRDDHADLTPHGVAVERVWWEETP